MEEENNHQDYGSYDDFLLEIKEENFIREKKLLQDKETELKEKEILIRKRQIRMMIASLNLMLNEHKVPALKEAVQQSIRHVQNLTKEDCIALSDEWVNLCMYFA